MRRRPYPLVPCKVCGKPFRRRPRATINGRIWLTEHCSLRCGHVTSADKLKGRAATAASAKRSELCQERWAVLLESQFGRLSAREIAILQAGKKRWYLAGYNAALRVRRTAA